MLPELITIALMVIAYRITIAYAKHYEKTVGK